MGLEELARQGADSLAGQMDVIERIGFRPTAWTAFTPHFASLLFHSFSHANAALLLLADQPHQHHASAATLCRSQLEAMTRAFYFAFAASPREIASFVMRDKMPQRRREKGDGRRTIYFKELCREASEQMGGCPILGELGKSGLPQHLHSATHTGAAMMHRAYRAEGEICFHIEDNVSSATLWMIARHAQHVLDFAVRNSANHAELCADPQYARSRDGMIELMNALSNQLIPEERNQGDTK